jgi:hypothetical protein
MNGSLPLPPPTRQHQPYHCGYDSDDDYGYDYFTHGLIMHHSFDTRTPTKSGKPKKDGDMRDSYKLSRASAGAPGGVILAY